MPKIPDRVKKQIRNPVFVKYTVGKDPKHPGIYACRIPSEIFDPPFCDDKFLYWSGVDWGYPGSDANFRGRVVSWLGPLQRRNDENPPPKTVAKWAIGNVGRSGFTYGPVDTIAECRKQPGLDGDVIYRIDPNDKIASPYHEWIISGKGGSWQDLIPF